MSTDKNIFDNSCQLVKYFLDFPLWENKITYLPKVKYLKQAILFSQSEKCFTNQQELSKIFLSVYLPCLTVFTLIMSNVWKLFWTPLPTLKSDVIYELSQLVKERKTQFVFGKLCQFGRDRVERIYCIQFLRATTFV